MSKCGTYAGYQRHIRNGETACDDCRTANRNYARRYRARRGTPPSQLALSRANWFAVKWVREHHPDVWERLLDAAHHTPGAERINRKSADA